MTEFARQIPPEAASSTVHLQSTISRPTAITGACALLLLVDLLLPWYATGAEAYPQSSTGVSSAGLRFLVLVGVGLVMAHFAFSSRLGSRASAFYVMALSFAVVVGVAWSFAAKSARGLGELVKPTAGSFVAASEIGYRYGIFAAAALSITMLVASVLRFQLTTKNQLTTEQSPAFPVPVRVVFAIGFVNGVVLLLASVGFVLFSV